MYASGEELQWYDPALLFPLCPLGGVASSSHEPQQGFLSRSSIHNDTDAAHLSPNGMHHRVQRRARELLLDRLSNDTLTNDRDACASIATLVKSLRRGEPAQLTETAAAPPKARNSNPLTDASSFPASLSGATAAQGGRRQHYGRRRHGAVPPLHVLSAGEAGDDFHALFGSDSDDGADSATTVCESGVDDGGVDEDDDVFSVGGWSGFGGGDGGGTRVDGAAAAQARELRSYFAALPTQLGVQETPVLCPLNLQKDPLAHVVAAAEVFAVVTATVPQVLYVFDQLNNLPISSSVLGGRTFTAGGNDSGASQADGQASLTQSFASAQRSCGDAARVASANSAALSIVSCTIAETDTVQQLWIDPSGRYCVLVFVSGKCVYYHIPRRPSAAAAALVSGAGEGAAAATATAAASSKVGADTEAAASDDDGTAGKQRRRRQERHREWKEAARRWLRFSRWRRSHGRGDDDGASEVDGAEGLMDGDAAYRPCGFSLTFTLPRDAFTTATAGEALTSAASCRPNVPLPVRPPDSTGSTTTTATATAAVSDAHLSRFVPSCVGWCRHLVASAQCTSTPFPGAAATTAATGPHGILKPRERPSASEAASKQLTFDTTVTHGAVTSGTSCSSSSSSSCAFNVAVEALLGAQQGGALLACLLTPAGAMDSRVVFRFPAAMARASLDSVAAICASAAPLYGDASGDTHGGGDGTATQGGGGGAPESSLTPSPSCAVSAARRVHWDQGESLPSLPACGDGANRHHNSKNDNATSAFLAYVHTPHFLSADEERRNADVGSSPPPPPPTAFTRGLGDAANVCHLHQSARLRRRWVVLISVKNRLYVFSTPSTTTDFSELEEIREASLLAADVAVTGTDSILNACPDGAIGGVVSGATPPPLIRSTLEAAARRLTGRVEDAFLPYAGRGGEGQRGSGAHCTSPITAFSTKPSFPPTTTGSGGASATVAAIAAATPRAAAAEHLRNYITLEPSAFSAYSSDGYSAAASHVHTAAPDVTVRATGNTAASPGADFAAGAAATCATSERESHEEKSSTRGDVCTVSPAAPFLLQSTTRGTLHLVLPPSSTSTDMLSDSTSRAAAATAASSGSGGGLVVAAALPPVFYWQYGDVLVQGLILCGAGGLEVGAKVRALVHDDMRASAAARAATASTVTASGGTRRDEVLPVEHVAAVSAVPAPYASGMEAGLTAIIDGALRDTQDLNVLVEAAGGAEKKGGCRAGGDGKGQGGDSPLHATSPLFSAAARATATAAAAQASVSPLKQLQSTLPSAQPAVLPIGLLSVTNVNSCLQSLRGFLNLASLTCRGGERGGDPGSLAKGHGLSFTRSTVRTTSPFTTSVARGLSGTPALPIPSNDGNSSGGGVGGELAEFVDMSEAGAPAAAAALCHPLLQFPWTSRVQLHDCKQSCAVRGATASAEEAEASTSRPGRHHRHRHQHTDPPPSSLSPLSCLQFTASTGNGVAKERRSCGPAKRTAGLDASRNVCLLSGALARGDVEADTVRRLTAVARAYVRRSPVLFDTPVEAILRATVAAAAPAHLVSRASPTQDSTSTSSPAPLSALMNETAAGVHSRTSSAGAPPQRAYSALPSMDARESRGRWQGGTRDVAFTSGARRAKVGGPLATAAGGLHSRDRFSQQPMNQPADDGVRLSPQGELLISLSASYSHLTFTTTEGVYVVAHAAVLPLVEAAVAWRRQLVYHSVTTRPPAATTTAAAAAVATTTSAGGPLPVPPSLSSPPPLLRAPLFTVMADPAAADMFYLASHARLVRLQTTSLTSSTAGLRQFVIQLLTKASATASQQQTRWPAQMSAHLAQSELCSGIAGTAGAEEEAMAQALHDAAAVTETVIVPSSLSYEVRLAALLPPPMVRARTGERGLSSHAEPESVSWRPSHPSRGGSAQRRRVPPSSNAGLSTGGACGEGANESPSSQSGGGIARMRDLERPAPVLFASDATRPITETANQGRQCESGGQQPLCAQSTAAVSSPRIPVSGACHFLRHANRRALQLVPRMATAASLSHSDSFDLPLPLFTHGLDEARPLQHRATATFTVPVTGAAADAETRASEHGPVAAAPTRACTTQLDLTRTFSGNKRGNGLWQGSFTGVDADYTAAAPCHTNTPQSHVSASFTQYASPLTHAATRRAARSQASQLQKAPSVLPGGVADAVTRETDVSSGAGDGHNSAGRAFAAAASTTLTATATAGAPAVAALGAASRAEDRDLASFLAENPLMHLLLQRSAAANRSEVEVAEGPSNLRPHMPTSVPHIASLPKQSRAVNIPGFGVLPGSAGLTPLAGVAANRAVASLLLHTPIGSSYYCADHLYELALAAAACTAHRASSSSSSASRRPVVTQGDVQLLHLVRHAYGGFLLAQQRFLEAAVQFGKAMDGPTPFTTILIELVRAFREDNSLEPLALFLQLRLRAWETSARGLGGHSMEVSVLATWLLSLQLEQCSIARAQRRRYEANSSDGGSAQTGFEQGDKISEKCSAAPRFRRVRETEAADSEDFTRVAWIRRRYHLDHPVALLEDTLLRYGRFVDWDVLSTSVARLASAQEAVLVAELQGSPEKTVMSLVLRERHYFAGLLRLQALLADPMSRSTQTRCLLQSLIGAQEAEVAGCAAVHGAAAAPSLTVPGTMPLTTVFYGGKVALTAGADQGYSSTSSSLLQPLPAPRDAAALPRTVAALFERLSTLFLCCYPCRFVKDGLLVLLHQHHDIPLPPRRLLPALLTYSQASNESVLEANGPPGVVLRALAVARRAERQRRHSDAYTVYTEEQKQRAAQTKKKRTKVNKKEVVMKKSTMLSEKGEASGMGDKALATGKQLCEVRSSTPRRGDDGAEQASSRNPVLRSSSDSSSSGSSSNSSNSIEEADDLALSTHDSPVSLAFPPVVDPSPPLTPATSSSSTSLSLDASYHETRVSNAQNAFLVDHADAPLDFEQPHPCLQSPLTAEEKGVEDEGEQQRGSGDYDPILLDDTSSRSRSYENGSDDVDEDIVLSPQPHTFQSRSAASSGTTTLSSSPRCRGGKASLPSYVDVEELADASSRLPSDPPAGFSASTSSSSPTSSTPTSSDVVDELLATSRSFSALFPTRSSSSLDDEEEDEAELEKASESSDSDVDGFDSPLIGLGSGIGADEGGGNGDVGLPKRNGEARRQRPRQRRAAAALQLRQALTPTLSAAIVAAAEADDAEASTQPPPSHLRGAPSRNRDPDNESRKSSADDSLEPVAQHAVLAYLHDLVFQHGVSADDFFDDGDDVAVFVTYVNVLARDGEAGALLHFAEQVALLHLRGVRDAGTAYRLLYVLRRCAAYHCWAGCAWMCYALGYPREAVELALRYVVGEEGVRLAVRLLQLLDERDRHRGQARRPHDGSDDAQQRQRRGQEEEEHEVTVVVRRSRRELWKLVARHLIKGCGHTKHGAQTALQLSLHSGGDNFNVTDVLPELPDSLFVAEMKAELLSSVRELSQRMRGLRTNTNALGRDTRVLHRELQVMTHQPLSMQVDERCVLCGQPALARPFTVYPRCRHLIHTSCYHHARQTMQQREEEEEEERTAEKRQDALLVSSSSLSSRHVLLSKTFDASVSSAPSSNLGRDASKWIQLRSSSTAATAENRLKKRSAAHNHPLAQSRTEEPTDSMECLLCARRYLRTMLQAPLHISLVGDDVRQFSNRVLLR